MLRSLNTQRNNLLRNGAKKREVEKLYGLSNTSKFSTLSDRELSQVYDEVKSYGKLSVMHDYPYYINSRDGLISSSVYEQNVKRYKRYKKKEYGINSQINQNVSINKAKFYDAMNYTSISNIKAKENQSAKSLQGKIVENMDYIVKNTRFMNKTQKQQYSRMVNRFRKLSPEQFLKFYHKTKEYKVNFDDLVKTSPKTLDFEMSLTNDSDEPLKVANNRLLDLDKELAIFMDRKPLLKGNRQ